MIYPMFKKSVEKSVAELGASGHVVDVNTVTNTGILIHQIRPNQQYIFDTYRDDPFLVMSEPPGAGKSAAVKFVMADRLVKDPNHKLIICIPQTWIAKSFGHVILEYEDGTQIEWDIDKDLTKQVMYTTKMKVLKRFLKKHRYPKGIHNRIMLTTHMTLAKVQTNGENLFHNTTIVLDEAHHLLYPENGNARVCNRIGSVIAEVIEADDPTSSIWLTTGTFFRGDKGCIIPPEILEKFAYHFLPLDQHWKYNIKHIRSFEFNFVIYKEDILKEVKEVMKNKKKSIIYCPFTGNLIRGIDKFIFRDRLIETIKSVWPGCNIMDLIDPNGREKRKDILFDDNFAKDIDVILSLKVFDEGSDWVYAEQILDLVPSDSLRVSAQRNGRLWRDCFGKYHLIYNAFLPFRADFEDEEERREHLSKSFNAFVGALLLRQIIDPVPYPKLSNAKPGDDSSKYEFTPDPFTEEVPYESQRQEILEMVTKNLMFLRNIKEEPTAEEARQCIRETLESYNIQEDKLDDITLHIAKILRQSTGQRRPGWTAESVDLSFMLEAGFDKIWQNDIYDGLLMFGTDVSGIKLFSEFRNTFDSRKSVYEWVKIAEVLAEKNDGVLQSIKWLKENGYKALAQAKIASPHLFAHIPQEQERDLTTRNEHVETAEKLAQENDGKLQTHAWLRKNGFKPLLQCMYKYPHLFEHIPRERKLRIDDKLEWVKIAEEIAEEHSGVLPNDWWLCHNGYGGLHMCKYKHPELFKHIPQDTRKSPNEIVAIAEDLAKNNGGKLQHIAWLVKNGYSNVVRCKQKKPDLFKHIIQDSRARPLTESVKIAEDLASKNGGKLPTYTWLIENGHKRLAGCINHNPEAFKHIPREYRR